MNLNYEIIYNIILYISIISNKYIYIYRYDIKNLLIYKYILIIILMGRDISSESSDYAVDYNDLLNLYKTNYEEMDIDILYDETAIELINSFERKIPLRKRYFFRLID